METKNQKRETKNQGLRTKNQNCLMTSDGTLKITDFGLMSDSTLSFLTSLPFCRQSDPDVAGQTANRSSSCGPDARGDATSDNVPSPLPHSNVMQLAEPC